MYKQLKSDNNYRTHLEGVLISEHVLRTGIKPMLCQKSYKLIPGTESKVINYQVANKQFSFLSISLVYDSSDQHRRIYDSCNAELASRKIKTVQLENASNTYSSFNTVKFDASDEQDKYQLYMQFIAWYCKSSSIVPLSDYAHNPTIQELPKMNEYFACGDEKMFINLRRGKGYTG